MKKLLFVLAFTFIVQQAFSQMYIVTASAIASDHPMSSCYSSSTNSTEGVLTTIDPLGNITYECLPRWDNTDHGGENLAVINLRLNSIIALGYKLLPQGSTSFTGTSLRGNWFLAIPWTSSGLEEVPTTLKSFTIRPNPANDFVDISLDYSLKGECEVVFISEAGYISHKQSIGNISKNEKYNIDISKIPAGKYLVTIVNGKTYTTPQKLIVL